jgi:class 3 adenylate cyclase
MKTEIIYETLFNQATELDRKSKVAVNTSLEYLGAKQASRQLGDKISVHFSEVVQSIESSPDVNDADTRALVIRFVKELATRMGKLCAEAYQNANEGALKEEGKAYMAASTAEQMRKQAEAHKAMARLRDQEDSPVQDNVQVPVQEEKGDEKPAVREDEPPVPITPRKLRKLRK